MIVRSTFGTHTGNTYVELFTPLLTGPSQCRYFYYLTGCNLANCYFVYDVQSSKSILFIPPIDPADVIWSGLPVSINDALSLYDVDEVRSTTTIDETLAYLAVQNNESSVYVIANQVADEIVFPGINGIDLKMLKPAIEAARVVKDEFEVALIRKANHISSLAHEAVMARAKSSMNEQELFATFLERCVSQGAREQAYHSVVASGRAAATLHYITNNAPLEYKQNVLLDAGAEWDNYASDIVSHYYQTKKSSN